MFRGVASGQVEVSVRRLGFAQAAVVLQVDSLAVTEVSIPLESVAIVLDPIVTSAPPDERSLSEVAGAVSVADTAAMRRDRTFGLHAGRGPPPENKRQRPETSEISGRVCRWLPGMGAARALVIG